MIKSFKSKALAQFYQNGSSPKIDSRLGRRLRLRLDRLNSADTADKMNLPGFDFHLLSGFVPPRWTVHVNGPWCMTFEFIEGDAYRVDFEQYH